jgi:hypothetical protein
MPKFLVVAGCALLLTVPAQAGNLLFCNEPTIPYIPSGYAADAWTMQSAEFEVQSYLNKVKGYLECLANEQEVVRREANRVLSQWNAEVSAYNLR